MKRIFFSLIFISLVVNAEAAKNQVHIYNDGTYRYIESNGIPDHSVGRFPNKHNPHTISKQDHQFRVPLHPQFADKVTMLELGMFGVAINGIPFEPGANEYYQNDPSIGLQYEALAEEVQLGMDKNNAHVQPNGMYHYHGLPHGLLKKMPEDENLLIGYAADGFPIFVNHGSPELRSSYYLGAGDRRVGPEGPYDGTFVQDYLYVLGGGDLDECNGRVMISPQYPEGIYTYFITENFPFIPRCFKGVPDSSFEKKQYSPSAHDHHDEHHPKGHHPPPPDGQRPPPHHPRP